MSWRALYVIGIARALQQRTPLRTAARKRTAAALAATETTDDYGILQQEMERGGASFTDCRIAPCGGAERAIVATAAHAKGSVLIRVPRALAITSDAALAYASGAAAKTLEGASDGDLLAVWLLEQDASSEFIKSLPTVADLAHLPVFWAGDDRALLAYSDVGRRLGGRVKSDDAFHAELRRVSPDYAASCDRERWAWAEARAGHETPDETSTGARSNSFDASVRLPGKDSTRATDPSESRPNRRRFD